MPSGSILGRAGWLFAGRITSDGLQLLFYAILVRRFGESGIGDYASAFAMASLLGLGVGLGLRHLVTREVLREPQMVQRYPSTFLLLQLILAITFAGVLHVISVVLSFSADVYWLSMFAFFSIALSHAAYSFMAMIEAAGAMRKSALAEVTGKMIIAFLGIGLLMYGAELAIIVTAHIVGMATFLLLAFLGARSIHGPFVAEINPKLLVSLFWLSLPFAASVALHELYSRVDILMLRGLSGAIEAGAYAIAYRSVETALAVSSIVGFAIFPSLASKDAKDLARRSEVFRDSLRWLGIIGGLGAVVAILAAEPLVALLFGPGLDRSAFLVKVMAGLFFIGCVKIPYWRLLYAVGREGTQLKIQGAATALNVALNAYLIPRYGALGACAASIISESTMLTGFHFVCRRIINPHLTRYRLGLIAAFGGAVVLGMAIVDDFHWLVVSFVACSGFIVIGMASRAITRSDLIVLGDFLSSGRRGR